MHEQFWVFDMMTRQRQQAQKGFTIVELLITIGILAILSAFAVPTMVKTMRKTQLNSEVRAVASAVQTARSDAVIQKKSKTVNWKELEDQKVLKLEHTTMSPSSPAIRYDFMGRLVDTGGNRVECVLIVIRHQQDPNVVASIEVREVGSPDILKEERSQCRV